MEGWISGSFGNSGVISGSSSGSISGVSTGSISGSSSGLSSISEGSTGSISGEGLVFGNSEGVDGRCFFDIIGV